MYPPQGGYGGPYMPHMMGPMGAYGSVPVANVGPSHYPPSFSYSSPGYRPGMGAAAFVGGVAGAAGTGLGIAQGAAGVASMFGAKGGLVTALSPSFGGGLLGIGAGLAVPAAIAGGVGYAGQQFAGGMQGNMQLQGILSNMSFANPAAASGRGFGYSQTHDIFSSMNQFQSQDAFVNMRDMMVLAKKFDEFKMNQGVKSTQEFVTRLRDMSKTVITMARDMGTTIEQATAAFGQTRLAGFVSGADIRNNVRQMMIAQGRGISQDQFMGAQAAGASTFRRMGLRGQAGARMVTDFSADVMRRIEGGGASREDLMDMFDSPDAGTASLEFGRLITERISGFVDTGPGQAFLGGAASRSGGRFTGGIDGSELDALLTMGGPGVQEAISGFSAATATREGQMSFVTNKSAIKDAFLSRESAAADVYKMIRALAERAGVGEDGIDLLIQKYLGLTERQAKEYREIAKAFESGRATRAAEIEREKAAAALQRELVQKGIQGRLTQIGGSISDFFSPVVATLGSYVSSGIGEGFQAVYDTAMGIDRGVSFSDTDAALFTAIGGGGGLDTSQIYDVVGQIGGSVNSFDSSVLGDALSRSTVRWRGVNERTYRDVSGDNFKSKADLIAKQARFETELTRLSSKKWSSPEALRSALADSFGLPKEAINYLVSLSTSTAGRSIQKMLVGGEVSTAISANLSDLGSGVVSAFTGSDQAEEVLRLGAVLGGASIDPSAYAALGARGFSESAISSYAALDPSVRGAAPEAFRRIQGAKTASSLSRYAPEMFAAGLGAQEVAEVISGLSTGDFGAVSQLLDKDLTGSVLGDLLGGYSTALGGAKDGLTGPDITRLLQGVGGASGADYDQIATDGITGDELRSLISERAGKQLTKAMSGTSLQKVTIDHLKATEDTAKAVKDLTLAIDSLMARAGLPSGVAVVSPDGGNE
jgi:hypothetical protein